ncbi:MAG: hypothetical protein JHC93_07515 [Parachlamydiales bacterium]|nr:hypothetical protein [Parachlamydiales bacterium]
MKKLLIFITFLVSQFCIVSADTFKKPDLTLWIRAYGDQAVNLLSDSIENYQKNLTPFFNLNYFIATYQDDPVEKYFKNMPQVTILTTNLESITDTFKILSNATPDDQAVLVISNGVEIMPQQIINAMGWLDTGAVIYGWKIEEMGNDGSVPGKGWYNTCALYNSRCVSFLKEHPLPFYVNPGIAGKLIIDGESIAIGGNEEIPLMAEYLKKEPKAFFVLDCFTPVHLKNQTGNQVSFAQKMKRKIPVAKFYIEKKLNTTVEDLWKHLNIITSENTLIIGSS